jgi:Tautomerase enzyme
MRCVRNFVNQQRQRRKHARPAKRRIEPSTEKHHRWNTPNMPLVTLTVQKPKSSAFKASVLDAIHVALVGAGVPATDRFQRVLEIAPEDLRFDATYPDLDKPRNENVMIIEILWSVGRSVKVKRALLADLMSRLGAQGIDPEQMMVCFKETGWENWSFAGGRLLHV